MAEKTPPKKRPARQLMQELLAQSEKDVSERREEALRPEEKAAAKATAAAIEVAQELSSRGVVESIGELKSGIGQMLRDLSDRLEEQVSRYAELQRAIAAKERELKDIYEIQRSASSLTALIEAHDRQRATMEEQLKEARSELEHEIEETRAGWDQERKQREAEAKERDVAEQKRREREKEEYRYVFAREQQQARDLFADELAKAQKELADRKLQTNKDLEQREKAVAAREQEFASLRQRVEAFPKELETAVNKAIKETTLRLEQEGAGREDLLKREFAGEKNVLSTRIASLEQMVKEHAERMAKLLVQTEKAYGQVQDIAVRAIEGSASAKQLSQLQQLLADQGRKGTAER